MPSRHLRFFTLAAKWVAVFIVGLSVAGLIGLNAPPVAAWGDNETIGIEQERVAGESAGVSVESTGGSSVSESGSSVDKGERSTRVIYHFVPEDEIESQRSVAEPEFSDYHDKTTSITAGKITREGGHTIIRANAFPSTMPVDTDRATFRVLKDYASTYERGAGVEDLTDLAHYDTESGTVSLPEEYADSDLTVVWYVPEGTGSIELPLSIVVNKTMNGTSSRGELTHCFAADAPVINIKLFDDEEIAARVSDIRITQGGRELTTYVYQNGSMSLVASPLGGTIDISLCDASGTRSESEKNGENENGTSRGTGDAGNESDKGSPVVDNEIAINEEVPRFSFFSAANPAVGERFNLAAGSALVRSCESSTNMAVITGWPEKSSTYGFTVHFNTCPNPDVVNADQNHIAPGGTLRTGNGGVYDYSWIKGLHFAWGECYGDVNDNGTGEPVLESGWVEVTNVDYNTQTVSYRYFLDVCSDIDGHNMQSVVGTFQVHEDLVGYLEIKKASGLSGISEGNSCYSFEGAKYGVYADEACTNLKDTLTTDAQGSARSKALQVGTYYLKEISAPAGYALDIDAHEITLSAGKTKSIELSDLPQSDPTPVLIGKHDSIFPYNGEHNNVQGEATTLGNAQFTVKFYPTLNSNYASANPARTWVFKTDEHGIINLRDGDGCKVSGDELYYDSHGFITLPLGTYVISETKAPTGYNKNETVFVKSVTGSQNGGEEVSSYNPPIMADPVIRGGVEIEKRDAESGELKPLGGASLDGAVFTVTNESARAVYIDGIAFQPGEVCRYLTIADGRASTAPNALPYGKYSLREVSPGEGYNPTSQVWNFSITQEGEVAKFCDTGNAGSFSSIKNQVKRGDLNFIKVREDTGERLEGIPFRITSQTSGESHVVVTDKNGIVNTSASWNKHTFKTNANDSDECDPEAGVWFGKTTSDTITAPNDSLGALPYDTYTLEELACERNEGLVLVKTEFSIYRDAQQLDFGVVEDHIPEESSEPWIWTVATDADEHDKLLSASSEVRINDHVRYGNLNPGENYTLQATLINTATGEAIEGAQGRTDFTPTNSTGTTEVSIPVNLLDQDANNIVVYETLMQDEETILEHHELDNSEQTLAVAQPRIGTTALDASDGDHDLLNEAGASIVDTVRYFNLIPNEKYLLKGAFMLAQPDSEETPYCELTDENGELVVAETEFIAEEANGSVEVTFTFDAGNLEQDQKIVVFEQLLHGEDELATHQDIDDPLQTIRVIEPEPPVDEPEVIIPYAETPKGGFDKTAAALLPWFALCGAFGICASALIAVAYQQHRTARAITEQIAQNMLNPRGRLK